MSPSLAASTFWGSKRGNLCVTAIVFIAQQPKFTRTSRSIVPLTPHNMSPNSGHFPPSGGINPRKGETIGHLRRALLPNSFSVLVINVAGHSCSLIFVPTSSQRSNGNDGAFQSEDRGFSPIKQATSTRIRASTSSGL